LRCKGRSTAAPIHIELLSGAPHSGAHVSCSSFTFRNPLQLFTLIFCV
jgi:hypothetical protein